MLNAEHTDDVHGDIEEQEESVMIQYLTKAVDRRGCLRLTLDIDEYFSRQEYQKMKEHMVKNKLF